jgi:hypothetical protein
LVFACGSCDSHRRPATLSCHRTSLYIRWSFACRRCFPGDFRPRAARPGFFRARFVFSALPVAATPCGSRYSLGTTQVRGTYAAEAVLPGVGSRRLAAVGQRFLFSPSNRVDHFALADSFGLSGFTCQTSFAFLRQPHAVADTGQMLLPGLAISFRCRTSLAGRLRYARPLHPCGSRRFRNAVLQSLPQSERCPFEQRPLHSLDCRNLVVTTDFSALLPALPRSRTLGLV